MRHFYDKKNQKQGFKGSILIVFPTEEKAKSFLDLEEIKYNGVLLIRKTYEDYLVEKKKEIEERKAKKEAKINQNAQKEKEAVEKVGIPEGTFIHMSGLVKEISREDIKSAFSKHTKDLAFVDYNKGDEAGYLRFSKASINKEILEKVGEKMSIKDTEIMFRIVEGDEEKEQIEKGNAARAKAIVSAGNKRRGDGGYGRGRKRRKY